MTDAAALFWQLRVPPEDAAAAARAKAWAALELPAVAAAAAALRGGPISRTFDGGYSGFAKGVLKQIHLLLDASIAGALLASEPSVIVVDAGGGVLTLGSDGGGRRGQLFNFFKGERDVTMTVTARAIDAYNLCGRMVAGYTIQARRTWAPSCRRLITSVQRACTPTQNYLPSKPGPLPPCPPPLPPPRPPRFRVAGHA